MTDPPVWEDHYELIAYWPNAASEPLREQFRTAKALIARALDLLDSGAHTSIIGRTTSNMEIIKLWGQLGEEHNLP